MTVLLWVMPVLSMVVVVAIGLAQLSNVRDVISHAHIRKH